MNRSSLLAIMITALLSGCGLPHFGPEQTPASDDLFGDIESRWDPEDRLLGMTPAEAAEVMNGHWVEDELAESPILVSNDALLLDGLSCFESASFDGESRLVASFSCDPVSQGVALDRILIKDGIEGFHRRIIELNVVGTDIVAETEAADFPDIYLVAKFRKQVMLDEQPLQMAPSGARDLTVNANWTVYDERIEGLDHRIKLGGKATLRGVLDYDFDVRLCSPAWWVPPYPCADYRAAAGLDTDLELRVILELGRSFSFGDEYPLPFSVPAGTFPLGGLPVIVEVTLEPALFWNVSAGARVATQIGVEANMLAMIGAGGTIPGLPENLSGVEFSNGRLQDPRFDQILSARARVGFKYSLVADFNRSLKLSGSVSPYLQAVATADCDEVDLALQHGVSSSLGISAGWEVFGRDLSVSHSFPVGSLGPYDIWGTSVSVPGLLEGDSDCVADASNDPDPAESFLPELPFHAGSNSSEWFHDHLDAMTEAMAEYDALINPTGPEPQLIRDVAFSVDGAGYWTLDEDGLVAAYGNAEHHGDMPEELIESHEPQGIVAMPSGTGYWIYTAAGRVMSFVDGTVTNEEDLTAQGEGAVIDMAAHPGGGYWLLEVDGDVHAFGGAPDFGSPGVSAIDVATALVAQPDGSGYLVATLGEQLFAFGSASEPDIDDLETLAGEHLVQGIVDMMALPAGGQVLLDSRGHLIAMGGADDSGWEGWEAVSNPHAMAITPTGRGGVVASGVDLLAAWGDVPLP